LQLITGKIIIRDWQHATNASKRFADAAAFKKPAASTPRPATPSKHPPIGKVISDHGPNRFDLDIEQHKLQSLQQKLHNLQQKVQNLQEKLSDLHLNCKKERKQFRTGTDRVNPTVSLKQSIAMASAGDDAM
jgi:peptidoglycan hydrolase CwlO-like protein